MLESDWSIQIMTHNYRLRDFMNQFFKWEIPISIIWIRFRMIDSYRKTVQSVVSKEEYQTAAEYSSPKWNGVTIFEFDRVLYTVGK